MIDDDLNLDGLRVFACVVRERSFSAAAEKLKRTKQSVHRQVKQFEESLAIKLFRRVKRHVVPTQAGLQLFHIAERILGESRLALSVLRNVGNNAPFRLRLTAPPLLAEEFLQNALFRFLREHPQAHIDCLLGNDLQDIAGSNIDMYIRIGHHDAANAQNLHATPLGMAARVLVAAPAYLKAHGTPHSPADLKTHQLLHFGNLDALFGARWSLSRKIEFKPLLAASSPRVILDAALAGLGVALLPEIICAKHLQKRSLVRVLADHSPGGIPIAIFTKDYLAGNPYVERLIELIRQEAETAHWLQPTAALRRTR